MIIAYCRRKPDRLLASAASFAVGAMLPLAVPGLVMALAALPAFLTAFPEVLGGMLIVQK